MKISTNGVALIKRWEGLELEAYQDIAGIWTIGYGHIETAKPGMRISEREAEELLKRDLKPREDAVTRLTKVPINQNEFDALVSFVYNVGIGAYQNSTARKRLNAGDRVGAAEALTWWNKATVDGVLREVTGLTRRRAAERALFLEPVNPPIVADNAQVAENSRVTPIEDAPRRPNLLESRSLQGAGVAGGAGVAAASMGRDTANELDKREIAIEQGAAAAPQPDGTGAPPPAEETPAEETTPSEETPDTPDAASDEGEAPEATPPATSQGVDIHTPVQSVEVGVERPSRHESHAVEAQIQLALMVLIVFAVLYVIMARLDDWWRFRR